MSDRDQSLARDEPQIKVIGVGGGGGNAVIHMAVSELTNVDYICLNTDVQALIRAQGVHTMQIGLALTKGQGSGGRPDIGRQAALEDRERIVEALEGADMVFITAGMGGGTGTGAAPVVAQLAKEMGILTVAVVTKPFPFEGRRRMQVALKGIEELSHHCDSLITIPNEKLITVLGREATMIQAFRAANDVLLSAVQGIADLIVRPGLINVDFADVRTVMSEMGMAMMGSGVARGEDRAMAAAEAAISNPLLDDVNLAGANGILVNITAGPDFTMREFDEVGRAIEEFASDDATVVIGSVLDQSMQDDVRVTVVVTGLDRARAKPLPESKNQDLERRRVPVRLPREATTGRVDMSAASVAMDYLDIPDFLRREERDSERSAKSPRIRVVAKTPATSERGDEDAAALALRDTILREEQWFDERQAINFIWQSNVGGTHREALLSKANNRELLAVRRHTQLLVPAFQFDTRARSVRACIASLLSAIPNEPLSWATVFWFFLPSSYLGGRKPSEVFIESPEKVIAMAKMEFEPDDTIW